MSVVGCNKGPQWHQHIATNVCDLSHEMDFLSILTHVKATCLLATCKFECVLMCCTLFDRLSKAGPLHADGGSLRRMLYRHVKMQSRVHPEVLSTFDEADQMLLVA
jgi:hypothetical protein